MGPAGTEYAGNGTPLAICRFPDGKPSMVSFTFDDGSADHFMHAAPMLEAHGFRGTFNITVDFIGRKQKLSWWRIKDLCRFIAGRAQPKIYVSWEQIKDLGNRGHEIGNHSMTHPDLVDLYNQKNFNRIDYEICAANQRIAEYSGFTPRTFCFPFSRHTPELDRIVRGMNLLHDNRRSFYGDWSTQEEHAIVLKKAIVPGQYSVLAFHGICPGGGGWAPIPSLELFAHILDDFKRNEDKLAYATFVDGASYEIRRDKATLTLVSQKPHQADYQLELAPDAKLYCGNLSVALKEPEKYSISVNGRDVVPKQVQSTGVFRAATGDVITLCHQ